MNNQMNTSSVIDFLEDEDYEPIRTAPKQVAEQPEKVTVSKAESVETDTKEERPKLPNRERITDGNARYLFFAAKFPGADSQAFSLIKQREDREVGSRIVLPTVRGTENRLRKMERLGALSKYLDPSTKAIHYSATKQGIDALYSFGYCADQAATLHGISKSRATHYRYIAHVAAQFSSPEGFFRESLGIEPVSLEELKSENEMRADYEPIKEMLKRNAKAGSSGDFGKWRNAELKASLTEASQGRISWADIVEARPALLTLGQPQREGTELKAVHQPDLAVLRDRERTGTAGRNLLVEVELSKKSWQAYNSILKTLKAELEHGFIYERAIYFTSGPQVETLLRKVDKSGGYGLFASGKLAVLPILDRNGDPVRFNNRINLGAI